MVEKTDLSKNKYKYNWNYKVWNKYILKLINLCFFTKI